MTEAGWRVLPSSRQQMAMSPFRSRRDAGRCSLCWQLGDSSQSLVLGPAPLAEAVGSLEALGV